MIPSLTQWVKDPALPQLWLRSQLQLGSDPWPRNSICLWGGQKRKKKVCPHPKSALPASAATSLGLPSWAPGPQHMHTCHCHLLPNLLGQSIKFWGCLIECVCPAGSRPLRKGKGGLFPGLLQVGLILSCNEIVPTGCRRTRTVWQSACAHRPGPRCRGPYLSQWQKTSSF